MPWLVQSIAVVIALATLPSGAQRAREVLRGQVEMLRRDQWRDRERIEALERRLLARGERDSPESVASEGIFAVLEEVSREISGLAEELRQRQWLEEAVASLQLKQEEEGRALRQLSRRVELLEQEQRNISQLILANIGPIQKENDPVLVSTINPWSEEGSGDLVGESLFPAVTSKNDVDLTGESQKETGKAVAVLNNKNGIEVNEKILNLSKQMHMNGSNALLVELNEHSKRLLALEMQTTNLTLQRCQNDGETYKSHLQIQNMDLRLTQIDHRIDESLKLYENHRKSNDNILRSYRDALANIARRTHNMSGEILSLTNVQTNLRLDINKFVKQLPKDCAKETISGVILIEVPILGPLEVLCDVTPDGGPWITIQRRFNGSESFFRDWTEYRNGFGDLKGEFWLGNKALHLLTRKRRMKLHIDMWDIQDRYFYAEYETFGIRSELDQYALEISNHSGNASDALTSHFGMGFSTFDKDNDASSANCAVHHTGGWWYQHCHRADLNGRYSLGMTWYDEYSQQWLQLVRVEMKIAPNEF